jgi:outer membrane protein assembly factor BamB
MSRGVPVVTCLGQVLIAVDPDSGERLWSRPLERPVRRLLKAWRHLFVADAGEPARIAWLDLATGEPRGVVDAGFVVTAALGAGTHVYFAGPDGALGLAADGSLVFRALLEGGEVVGRDADGRELWRVPAAGPRGDGVLLVGDAVAQPDIDT